MARDDNKCKYDTWGARCNQTANCKPGGCVVHCCANHCPVVSDYHKKHCVYHANKEKLNIKLHKKRINKKAKDTLWKVARRMQDNDDMETRAKTFEAASGSADCTCKVGCECRECLTWGPPK